jgi:hypothetical protein
MFTTGSKLLIGAAVAAIVAAVLYGVTQEGVLGTIGLVSAAVALAFLAGVNVYVRDATVRPDDAVAVATSAAAQPAPGLSLWPLVAVLGAALVTVGLVSYPAFTILGIAVLVAAFAEWTVQAWAERASGDPEYNEEVRERIASPLELPILGAVGVGLIIYAFSRIMLSLTKNGTVALFAVVAAIVLLVGFLVAARPRLSGGAVAGVCSFGAIALFAGGAVAGVDGEREMHVHETTADLAEEGLCGVEETEADEKASQTVAAKSSVAATITLDEAGALTYDQPGADLGGPLQLPRSSPTNVLFRNDSDEERRLVINVGPGDVSGGEGTIEGSDSGGEGTQRTVCTALVEPGGVQFLTLTFAKPSFSVEGGFNFTVPGVDDAVLAVVVP